MKNLKYIYESNNEEVYAKSPRKIRVDHDKFVANGLNAQEQRKYSHAQRNARGEKRRKG